jgi:FkbM family methyltransferase
MSRFSTWIPALKFFPFQTFPQRVIRKLLFVSRNTFYASRHLLGISGASILWNGDFSEREREREREVTVSGNHILRLKSDCALGCVGTVLELPRDRVIYESVRIKGSWELELCKFLAFGLKKACLQPQMRVALLDIGANTGLVTLQTMNLSNTTNDVFLFEPVPRHVSAIRQNLKNLSNIHVNEFALSNKSANSYIFTQADNHGNTSLIKSVVPVTHRISTQIQLVETTEYCNKFLSNFDKYVIKCDTQGTDALILSRIPERIWKNCESAVIEVWAIQEINRRDVESLISMFQEFEYVNWYPNAWRKKRIELNEVKEFWLSKTGASKNLFLSKKS